MILWNGLMLLFLTTFIASALARGALKHLNIRHLRRHGQEIPEAFRGEIDGQTLTYRATVPANTTARLYLPTSSAESVKEGGAEASRASGVTFVKYENGRAVYTLVSGRHPFVAIR